MSSRSVGRPRSFDRDSARDQALLLFWTKGYEATSISDLTVELGIGPKSLYAAFGSKQALFEEVLAQYDRRYRSFMAAALSEEPTLRAGLERLLREAADAYTRPGMPRGCLVISAAVNCNTPEIEQTLRSLRTAGERQLRRLIARAITAGELREDADAAALASLIGVLMQGMAQQARDGAPRARLKAAALTALDGWPWIS